MSPNRFSAGSCAAVGSGLCQHWQENRLRRNISQAELAKRTGVCRSSLTRIADGQGISPDSFIRTVKVLRLAAHFAALLPGPTVRPVELVKHEGRQRRRASAKRQRARTTPCTRD